MQKACVGGDIDDWWNFLWRLHWNTIPLDFVGILGERPGSVAWPGMGNPPRVGESGEVHGIVQLCWCEPSRTSPLLSLVLDQYITCEITSLLLEQAPRWIVKARSQGMSSL